MSNTPLAYVNSASGIEPTQLEGFFVGWPNPPSPQTHLRLLRKSDRVVLAVDQDRDIVVGFITAIDDRTLSAYIPFLEVLPNYQGIGIGTELVTRMLESLNGFYMIDLVCDPGLRRYYQRLGFSETAAMSIREYRYQFGFTGAE